ncbi:MAG: MotA/TolQ/ExbB proton channel family protein [Desulfovibrionaceae bacterium]|nr:MotA/TolQ/ExbB proton channel family protein [Desulfovibrionaceae bacterium]
MWDIFLAGGPVMWPLLLCSIVVFAVIFERIWFWRGFNSESEREVIENLLEDFRTRGDQWQETDSLSYKSSYGAALKMLLCGLAHRRFSMSKAMEAEAFEAVQKMRRGMGVLDTMITAAPMLGILGTVIGIISSFDMLAQAGVDDPRAVIGGVAQALITTAAGLIISLCALFPFNYFNARIESAQDVLESYAARLEMLQDRLEKGK